MKLPMGIFWVLACVPLSGMHEVPPVAVAHQAIIQAGARWESSSECKKRLCIAAGFSLIIMVPLCAGLYVYSASLFSDLGQGSGASLEA